MHLYTGVQKFEVRNLLKEINTVAHQGQIKFIKSDFYILNKCCPFERSICEIILKKMKFHLRFKP